MIHNRFLSFCTIISVFSCFTLGSCSDDVEIVSEGDEYATVTFDADLDAGIESRAISDGLSVNKIDVLVFDGQELVQRIPDQAFNPAGGNNLKLRLLSNRTYSVIFWAYNSSNNSCAYTLSDAGEVSVDYDNYAIIDNFSNIEQLDAFYAKESVTISGNNSSQNVTLTRPFAQVNFADNATKPVNGTHSCEITYTSLPNKFSLLSGTATGSVDNVKFTFNRFTDEELTVGVTAYYYVASNYIFVPQDGKVSATCVLKDGNTEITNKTVNDIVVAANKRTNICGTIVQAPEDKWDGTVSLPLSTDEQSRYIISSTANLAWLAQNGTTLEPNRTFVITKDLDMNNKSLQTVKLPVGSTVEGGEHTVKNLNINGGGLFGDVTNLTVKNLTVDGLTMIGAATHVGALVNTLKGTGAFTGVAVKNAVVSTTNGAAGGFVGYVVRKSEKDRTETLALTFSNSTIASTTIAGSKSEGKFVGLLSGYDNAETVSFDATCTVADNVTIADFASPYREGNEGFWLAETDYSKYNGWLGDETYNRGTVNYGGSRFIPCWDGSKTVEPLTDNGAKLIYSAFDLAKLQGGNVGTIKLMENVDMEYDLDGASKAGVRMNIFTPLNTLTKLEGNYKTIYNISIRDNHYGGFVKSESCASTFENVTFDGADIRVTHEESSGDAYVGTLRGYAYAKTIINNVNVKNCYLYGVNKMGGLCGGIFADLECSNNSVSSCYFENYNSGVTDNLGFLSNGEIGGLIGFIAGNSTIENCKTSANTFYCLGVDDNILTAGRHINGFIGDIRTPNAEVIRINSCSSVNNVFNTENGRRAQDVYTYSENIGSFFKPNYVSKTLDLMGCCYYISLVVITDTKGTLYVDGDEYKVVMNKS